MGIQQMLLATGSGVSGLGVILPWYVYQFGYGGAQAGFGLRANGEIFSVPDPFPPGYKGSPNWYSPTTPGIGASYWVRVTLVSGSIGGFPILGSWIAATDEANLQWYSGSDANLTLEFATDSGGATIVATVPGWILKAENAS
jgi:hypothetical protein